MSSVSYETYFYAKLNEAIKTRKPYFLCKPSALVLSLLNILREHGYILSFRYRELSKDRLLVSRRRKKGYNGLLLEVYLYQYGESSLGLEEFTVFSTPGRSIFVSYKNLHRYSRLRSLLVLSTPQGLLRGQEAIKKRVGGKLLFRVT